VIIEGVFMYLSHAQRQQLLGALRELFPHHVLYCDLMTRFFMRTYSRRVHSAIMALGTSFQDMEAEPEALFLREGYKAVARTSIPLSAAERGAMSVPAFLIRLSRSARDGYQIWKFEQTAPT
jgi:O-methyltransferase involved in polyketide biosynthesis